MIQKVLEGADEDSFKDKVGKAEQIIDEMDVEDGFVIKPYTDFDGPVRTRGVGGEEFHEGVKEAFDELVMDEDVLNPGIISGRGLGYLLKQIENLGITEVDVAGEMGSVYFPLDEFNPKSDISPTGFDPRFVVPREEESMENIHRFNEILFENLAEHDLQLMYGDNKSNVVGSACVEAFGINLDEDRFSIEDTVYSDIYGDATMSRIQGGLKQKDSLLQDSYDFQNDMIRIDKSIEAIDALTDALRANPFVPLGVMDEGDEFLFYPKYTASEDFTEGHFNSFVDSVKNQYNKEADVDFWAGKYSDYSFDFGKENYKNLKARAAYQILQYHSISPFGDILVTNTGDKPTDIIGTSNSLFFAQEGTAAHAYCENKAIPYIPVENTTESFAIQQELASRD